MRGDASPTMCMRQNAARCNDQLHFSANSNCSAGFCSAGAGALRPPQSRISWSLGPEFIALAKNCSKCSLSGDKTWSTSFRNLRTSKHTVKEIDEAVSLAQCMIEDAMQKHRTTSHRQTLWEDEIHFTENGSLVKRGLQQTGSRNKARNSTDSSHSKGWMFNSVTQHPRAHFVCHKKTSQGKWANDPSSRFRVEEVRRNTHQVNVPPSGKIDARTHLWMSRAVHKQQRKLHLHGCDGAGPHAGELIKHAIRSMNGVPLCAPKGGHSSVAQMNDDCRFHGAVKQHVRRRSGQAFLRKAREMAARNQQFKMQKITLNELCDWMQEWLDTVSPDALLKLCRECHPPLCGSSQDLRKAEMKDCLERCDGPRQLPEREIKPSTHKCARCGQMHAEMHN